MLVSMGHTVGDSDLYRMGFRPVLNERDFTDRALTDRYGPSIEIRHALSNGALSTPSTQAAATWAAP